MRIERGITRTVFITRRWAIKVPSSRANGNGVRGVLWSLTRGVQANLSELEWSGSPGVCPVRWSLAGLVSVYPRCESVDPDLVVDFQSIGCLGPADKKHQNLGWLDGRIVFVDYDMSWNDCAHGKNPTPVDEDADA